MKDEKEIEKLKNDLYSTDWDKIKESANQLFEIGGQQNIDYLIGLLDQSNSALRNAVALTFMSNKFNEGLEPLLSSILKDANRNTRGTMVYALQSLDCNKKLKYLFDILFSATKNWEVQTGIISVLDVQKFEFTKDELLEIQNKWDKLKDDWDELNGIDRKNLKEYQIDSELIQDFIDRYASILQSN